MAKNNSMVKLAVIMVVAVFVGGLGFLYVGQKANLLGGAQLTISTGGVQQDGVPVTQPTIITTPKDNCADNRGVTFGYVTKSPVDTSVASDYINATTYIVGLTGGIVATLTDTDQAPGTTTLNCGETYYAKTIGSSAVGGANSKVQRITYQTAGSEAEVVGGGFVKFKAVGNTQRIEVDVNRRAGLEFRVKDLIADAYENHWNSANASTTFAGQTGFASSTSNVSNLTIGSGGDLNIQVEYRANTTAGDWNDNGYWVLLDLAASDYNIPTVFVNGAEIARSEAQYTDSEKRAFTAFEYGYFVDSKVVNTINRLVIDDKAASGVNPSSDLVVAFRPRGGFLARGGLDVAVGAIQDDSALTQVYTLHQITQFID